MADYKLKTGAKGWSVIYTFIAVALLFTLYFQFLDGGFQFSQVIIFGAILALIYFSISYWKRTLIIRNGEVFYRDFLWSKAIKFSDIISMKEAINYRRGRASGIRLLIVSNTGSISLSNSRSYKDYKQMYTELEHATGKKVDVITDTGLSYWTGLPIGVKHSSDLKSDKQDSKNN